MSSTSIARRCRLPRFESADFDSLGLDSEAFVSLGLLSPFASDDDEPPSDDFEESVRRRVPLDRCAFLP